MLLQNTWLAYNKKCLQYVGLFKTLALTVRGLELNSHSRDFYCWILCLEGGLGQKQP